MRGTTTVVPLESGAGWLTSGVSVTRMVRLPCAIATVLIRTLAPITMVPLASSITTMAAVVRLDAQILERGQRLDRVAAGEVERDGARIGRLGDRAERLVDRRRRCAARWSGPDCAARAGARWSCRAGRRSRAPPSRRWRCAPTVGTPRVTEVAAPRAAIAPVASAPWATA